MINSLKKIVVDKIITNCRRVYRRYNNTWANMINSMGDIASQSWVFNAFQKEKENIIEEEGEVNHFITLKLTVNNRCQ